jgi:PLP dependent protein
MVENLAHIQSRICEAAHRAGRDPDGVRIVAAAKGQGRDRIREAIAAGVGYIGHNYVQEALQERVDDHPLNVEFHLIGHLQKNKAGKAVELFHMLHTVDEPELATVLNRRARDIGRVVDVLIQVNLAAEPQKSGVDEAGVEQLASAVRELPYLRLRGLMTMPPFFDDPHRARPYFSRLRTLRDKLIDAGTFTATMTELSMGMTGDFEVAVEEGATLVRIGTALFGPRL